MERTGKDFWGPAVWKTIHCLAAAYTPDQKNSYRAFIMSLTQTLPCEVCRQHLVENLKQLKIDDYLTDNHSLFLWSYFLHDLTNKKLEKKSPSYQSVKLAYFNGMGPECTACSVKLG